MNGGYLLLTSVGDGSRLALLASADCDIRQIGYEMAVLVERGWLGSPGIADFRRSATKHVTYYPPTYPIIDPTRSRSPPFTAGGCASAGLVPPPLAP